MSRRVLLLGAGGHGRVALDALLQSNVAVSGILDPKLQLGAVIFGVPVLGGDEILEDAAPADVVLVNGIGANPRTATRQRIFERLQARGFEFVSVRHGSATIGRECRLEMGCQVMAGAVVQPNVRLGRNAVVNTRAIVDHDCVLAAHAFISPGAILSGDVIVEEAAFIGAGAVLLPGVVVGASAVVGAGAVVTKNVAAGWIVAGNPAARIGAIE